MYAILSEKQLFDIILRKSEISGSSVFFRPVVKAFRLLAKTGNYINKVVV